jgi:hypothetical protein
MSVFFLFFLSSFLLQPLLCRQPWLQLARSPTPPARSPPPPDARLGRRPIAPAAEAQPDARPQTRAARRTPADPRSRMPASPPRPLLLVAPASCWLADPACCSRSLLAALLAAGSMCQLQLLADCAREMAKLVSICSHFGRNSIGTSISIK